MSRTDHHNAPARHLRTNAEIRNGVITFVPKRPILDADAAIAEQTAPEQIERTEDGLRKLAVMRRKIERRERAIETARSLPKRPFPRVAPVASRPVPRVGTRVQMVPDRTSYVASQGRIPRVGRQVSGGRHIADMDAGAPQSLMAMAKRRSA